MIKPEKEEVVSPPTKSTLYCLQAALIPSYNSSNASNGKRFETANDTVICSAFPFMAQMSDTFTATALKPKCFKGMYIKLK